MLRLVGFPDPKKAVNTYPFELSGGLRQRAMIAMALICRPALLIADEPTTALDVTIQAQILHLLADLQREYQMALILITHDLGVVARMADRVIVMYGGKIQEIAPVRELFRNPMHPYTRGLLAAIPHMGDGETRRLNEIEGMVPALTALPPGCAFAPRCSYASARCGAGTPAPAEHSLSATHRVRCHHPLVYPADGATEAITP